MDAILTMHNTDIGTYLSLMAEKGASDLFFTVGAPINIKIHGLVQPLNDIVLEQDTVRLLACSLISESQRAEFESTMELNFAHDIPGVGRFRINLYRQRGEVSMVIRYIKSRIPSMEELHLPEILKTLVMEAREISGHPLLIPLFNPAKEKNIGTPTPYSTLQSCKRKV